MTPGGEVEVDATLRADFREADCGSSGICVISLVSADTAASSSASSSSEESSKPFRSAAVWSSSTSSWESESLEMAISSSAGTGAGAGGALGGSILAFDFVVVGFSSFVSFLAFFGGVDVVGAATLSC